MIGYLMELTGIIMVAMAAGTSDYAALVSGGSTTFADRLALAGVVIAAVGAIIARRPERRR